MVFFWRKALWSTCHADWCGNLGGVCGTVQEKKSVVGGPLK